MKEDIDEMVANDVVGIEIPVEGKGEIDYGAEKSSFFTRMGEKNLGQGARIERGDVEFSILDNILHIVEVPSGGEGVGVTCYYKYKKNKVKTFRP